MKKLACILAVSVLATMNAQAINLLHGHRELGLSGLIDSDTADDTLIAVDVTYGYFWADFIESGLRAGISDSDSVSSWRLGGFTEYHFFNDTLLIPFLGVSVDLLGSDIEMEEIKSDENAIAIGADAGVKYFITEAVAISTQLGVDVATEDVYASEDGPEDVNWDLTLGMRFFF